MVLSGRDVCHDTIILTKAFVLNGSYVDMKEISIRNGGLELRVKSVLLMLTHFAG